MSKTYLAHGIVLRVRPLGEKDRIITILTEEFGIIRASARGARNPKSKLAAITQPFVKAHFALACGRNLDILTQAQIDTSHLEITTDVTKIAWSSYLCELCDALPEKMPAPEIYLMLEAALERLAASKSTFDQRIVGHWFEACYLACQGYAPTIGYCVLCHHKIVVPRNEQMQLTPFSVLAGGTLCESCARSARGMRKVSVQILRTLHRLTLCEFPPDEARVQQTWHIDHILLKQLGDLLEQCMEQHPEIRTKSRKFLTEMLTI